VPSSSPGELQRGKLLVATPPLTDPNFDRTVVLLLEYGDDGALGIILNRPTDTELVDALPDWSPLASAPGVVFAGGPVMPDSVIALARAAPGSTDGWIPVLGDLGTVDVGRDPAVLGAELRALRVFVGYAGWARMQLEGELAEGAWFVVDAQAADPFTTDPSALWRAVLRRQRGRVAMFASCPSDPSVN
jgi:putative transcriptional regulator